MTNVTLEIILWHSDNICNSSTYYKLYDVYLMLANSKIDWQNTLTTTDDILLVKSIKKTQQNIGLFWWT